jgi:hypothetical protein
MPHYRLNITGTQLGAGAGFVTERTDKYLIARILNGGLARRRRPRSTEVAVTFLRRLTRASPNKSDQSERSGVGKASSCRHFRLWPLSLA